MDERLEDEFNPEEWETFENINDLFADFKRRDKSWEKRHPLRAALRGWLDKTFPNGIAEKRAYYVLQRPWEILFYWRREIKYAYQRVKRGWDDTAAWHVAYYLSKTIPPVIRRLKEVNHGIPLGMYTEEELDIINGPHELGGITKDGEYVETEADKRATEKWNAILDEIADGFESWIKFDENYDGKIPYKEDENYKKFLRAIDLLREYYGDLWD